MTHRGRKNIYDFMPTPLRPAPKRAPKRPPIEVPQHLSADMQVWFRQVVEGYQLDHHHLHILRLACEAFDRAQAAREQVLREGPTFVDKNSNLRAHSAIAVERDARSAFAKLVKQLNLEPAKPDGRLGPRLGGGIGITFDRTDD
jgi:P27 family predicted phage terminase small subunit